MSRKTGIETLKEFCLLRAESVSGQLDGTISSTSEGQTQDSRTLVDAPNITISDMGSMNNGMGGGMADGGNRPGRMGDFDLEAGTQPSEQTQTDTPSSPAADELESGAVRVFQPDQNAAGDPSLDEETGETQTALPTLPDGDLPQMGRK